MAILPVSTLEQWIKRSGSPLDTEEVTSLPPTVEATKSGAMGGGGRSNADVDVDVSASATFGNHPHLHIWLAPPEA